MMQPSILSSSSVDQASAAPAVVPGFAEAFWLWLRIGCLSFGGAAAQVALMHRLVVEERRWVDERTFLDALNYCTLLPGPEAQQLATYIGWRWHGVRGGIVAGACFVVPGALVMLGLSFLYVLGRNLPLVAGALLGIQAAVLAIVADALIRIGRKALTRRILVVLAVVAFLSLALLKVPFPAVVIAAGAIGAMQAWQGQKGGMPPSHVSSAPLPEGAGRRAVLAALVWVGVWWLPVGLAALWLGPEHRLVDLGLFFSKLAVVTFGGAYAVLAYLAEAAVQAKGWLTATEMVDGLGLAETTPGPTILVNQFVGFLAGWREAAPLSPALMATLAAAMTVWVTFAPSYVWIFAGAPLFERLRGHPVVAGALQGITAAVVGIIASLALTFAVTVLFAESVAYQTGSLRLTLPRPGSVRPEALLLALVAAFLLFGLRRGVIVTVLAMAGLGMGWALLR